MNFFAEQMNRIFENSTIYKLKSESNKGVYIKINGNYFANVEFVESQAEAGFDRISVKVINKTYGLVDCATFDLKNFIGNVYIKYSIPSRAFVWFYKNYNECYQSLDNDEYKKLYHLISGYFNMFV